jgi:hypothetical protein
VFAADAAMSMVPHDAPLRKSLSLKLTNIAWAEVSEKRRTSKFKMRPIDFLMMLPFFVVIHMAICAAIFLDSRSKNRAITLPSF